MTDTMIGLIGGAILIPLLLTSIVIAVIAHKHVETIEAYLPNCSYITTVKEAYSGGGLLGKIMRGGVIAMILMMPQLSARRGFVDAREIKNLPNHYKKLLVIPAITSAALFIALILLQALRYILER
ncbi:hypothetical protein N018_24170 [Pseudomonas syringae CC1557]|uniref:Uncharacterized protein n=1 Tax=Pseudomonas syringae CC1557 TaxID=1357279 RepID=W0N266_PSESX|nr:hypothetical protein [Pseudomonas syringae]AHG43161.1 hypothetical protein N018_24170 [Pseudomonas syringae CC1557]